MARTGPHTLFSLGFGVLLLVLASPVFGQQADNSWPREIKTDKGTLTIYQPQPEKFTNNLLQARAAISLIPTGKTAPVFGVMWFNGRVDTDRDTNQSLLRNIQVTATRWPVKFTPSCGQAPVW